MGWETLGKRGSEPARAADAAHARTGRGRRAAGGFLAIVLGLMLLMVLSIVGTSRQDGWGTEAWSIAPWSFRAVPVLQPVQLSQSPRIWLERGKVTLQAPKLREGSVASSRSLDATWPAAIQSAARIVLNDPRLLWNIALQADGDAGRSEVMAVSPLLDPLLRLAFDKLVIKRGEISLPRPSGGHELIESVDADILNAAGRGLTGAQGTFTLRGEPVRFTSALSPVVERDGQRRLPLRLNISSALLEAAFEGTVNLTDGLEAAGKLDLTITDMRRFARWLGVELPNGSGFGAVTAKGPVTWKGGVLSYDNAAIVVDGNAATGTFALNLGGPRPALDGTLAFKSLDIQPYWQAAAQGQAAGRLDPARTQPISLGDDIRAPLIEQVDADLRISAVKVTGFGWDMGRGALSLTLRSGRLAANLAEQQVRDGTASGQLTLHSSRQEARYSVRGRLDNVAIETLLAPLGMTFTRGLEGKGSLGIDLAGRGRTLGEMVKTLNGEAALTMPQGGRVALNLRKLLIDARARKPADWPGVLAGDTGFDELQAKFALRDGSLVSESLRLKSGNFALTGDGTVNLGARQLYMRLLFDNGATVALAPRAERMETLVLLGPWAEPGVTLDQPVPVAAGNGPRP
jgi:hypothetical protein